MEGGKFLNISVPVNFTRNIFLSSMGTNGMWRTKELKEKAERKKRKEKKRKK
jgi:hypothetical protein